MTTNKTVSYNVPEVWKDLAAKDLGLSFSAISIRKIILSCLGCRGYGKSLQCSLGPDSVAEGGYQMGIFHICIVSYLADTVKKAVSS